MSRPMVKKSDGGERHEVLNGENSQLQKRREVQETTHREKRKIKISAHLRAGRNTVPSKCPHEVLKTVPFLESR